MTEVGRISIRVMPDTARFREELYADLKRIEQGERAKVPVEPELKAGDLKEKVEAAAKAADAKTTVKVDTDTSQMQKRLGEVNLAFQKAMQRSLDQKPLNGVGGFQNSIEDMKRRMDQVSLGWDKRVQDMMSSRPQLNMDSGWLGRMNLRMMEARIHLDPTLDSAKLEELKAKLAMENFRIHVKVDTDRMNFERMARNSEASIDKAFDKIFAAPKQLSKSAGGGGQFGPHMGGMGMMNQLFNFGSPVNLVAIASLIPAAIAIIAPALASLPALLSAVGAPLGVLMFGLDGIKKALDDAGLLSQKDSKDGFGKSKSKLTGSLKDMQDAVGKSFETGLTPVFKELAGIIPRVTPMLTVMADSMVTVAQALAGFVTNPQTVSVIGALMSNISAMIADMAPGLVSFSNGILNLAAGVSTHFPQMATWFDQLGNRFSNWVTKIQNNGTLDKSMSLLGQVGSKIVDFVGTLMDKGMKFAADPQMQKAIGSFLDSLSTLVTGGLLDGLAKAFVDLTPAIGDIINLLDKIDSVARDLGFSSLDKPNSGSQPGAGQGGGLMPSKLPGGVMDLSVGQNPGKSLGQSYLESFKSMPGQLASLAEQAVSGLVMVFTAIPAKLAGIGVQAAQTLYQGIVTVVGMMAGVVAQIAAAFASLPGRMVTIGVQMAQGLANGIRSAAGSVIGAATDLANKALSALHIPLQIHSPSRVTTGYGKNFGDGFVNGIKSRHKAAQNAAGGLAKVSAHAMLKEMANTPAARMQDAFKQSFAPSKFVGMGTSFLHANESQMFQDLGISGKGAIPTIANSLLDWGSNTLGKSLDNLIQPQQYMHPSKAGVMDNITGKQSGDLHIHVGGTDDALKVKQNAMNKRALQYTGR